jgi:rubrerythrin
MTILTPTKDNGAKTRTNGVVYAEAACTVDDESLSSVLADSGLNGLFIADLLSAALAHERCGRHLYRSVAERTHNPMLESKYQEFGRETERHAEILERLIVAIGGDPGYVSPMARAVEGTDAQLLQSTFLLSGGLDPMTQEMAMLGAVFIAESVDHSHWEVLGKLAQEIPEGDMRTAFHDAVNEVEPEEDEHLAWARDTKARMTMLQAKSSLAATAAMKVEEMTATIKDWFRS